MKICEEFTLNFGDRKQKMQSGTTFFTREFFTKNNMNAIYHPLYSPDLAPCDFSLFPELTLHHFNTNEVIEPESQVVLNILTSRKYLKNDRNAGNGAYTQKGTTSRVIMASRPKDVFDQIAAPVSYVMDICRRDLWKALVNTGMNNAVFWDVTLCGCCKN
jgi:hypothetical protein